MTPVVAAFLLVGSLALLCLPRRFAALPVIVGACYMTREQGVDIGPFTFSVIRILVVVGVLRILVRGEHAAVRLNTLDWLILAWFSWMVASVFFHNEINVQIVYRLRLAFEGVGLYFLFRVLCPSQEEIGGLVATLAVALVPVAAAMVLEKVTLHNVFAIFGGVPEVAIVRNGVVRAQGPFAHPILAGTVGAVCLPLMIGIWRLSPVKAGLGCCACLAIVFASGSSGPILSAGVGLLGILMWGQRYRMRMIRWTAFASFVALDIVMKAPAYYLISRIDFTGGSTGYHRARLIESSLDHLSEWWLVGTDVTRHWMATGVAASPDHTDITNHYLGMGVLGGLPLMFLFIATIIAGFSYVGQGLRSESASSNRFLIWSCGAALFAHAATAISISYFDQSILFLYLTLALASGCRPVATAGEPVSNTTRLRAATNLAARRHLRARRSVDGPSTEGRPDVGSQGEEVWAGNRPAYRNRPPKLLPAPKRL